MGWKEKRFLRKLKKQIKIYSNCDKHYWIGPKCVLCGIEVVFVPYKDMPMEEKQKYIEDLKKMVDLVTELIK